MLEVLPIEIIVFSDFLLKLSLELTDLFLSKPLGAGLVFFSKHLDISVLFEPTSPTKKKEDNRSCVEKFYLTLLLFDLLSRY